MRTDTQGAHQSTSYANLRALNVDGSMDYLLRVARYSGLLELRGEVSEPLGGLIKDPFHRWVALLRGVCLSLYRGDAGGLRSVPKLNVR
jgi:hypothetical protein